MIQSDTQQPQDHTKAVLETGDSFLELTAVDFNLTQSTRISTTAGNYNHESSRSKNKGKGKGRSPNAEKYQLSKHVVLLLTHRNRAYLTRPFLSTKASWLPRPSPIALHSL